MSHREHWETVYSGKAPDKVSWFRPRLDQSLVFVDAAQLPADAHVVDIGGGASTLVDDLLARGFQRPTVIDLSARALEHSQARLGEAAAAVRWVVGDATTPLLPNASVDLWHDRAVFHFLTDPDARGAYIAQVHRCVRPGGHVVIATFALDGPERCSGLPTARYAPAGIAAALGAAFELVGDAHEVHETPHGGAQAFAYAHLRRRA